MRTSFSPPSVGVAAVLCAALLAAACSGPGPSANPATGSAAATPRAASAELVTAAGEKWGQAMLTAVPTGVEVVLSVSGMVPGAHGFHIHAQGACAPGPDPATGNTVDFGAAGAHFDPGNSHNHGRPGDPAHASHAGELPNLVVDASGKGTLRYVNQQVSLAPGKASVIGRTLVVHADPDDYQSAPAGKAGARILCGVIHPAQVGSVVGSVTPSTTAVPSARMTAADVAVWTEAIGDSHGQAGGGVSEKVPRAGVHPRTDVC